VSKAIRLIEEAQGILDSAEQQERALSGGERTHVETLLDRARAQGQTEKALKDIGQQLGPPSMSAIDGLGQLRGARAGGDDPGVRFVNSPGFKRIADSGNRGESWTTGLIDVGPAGAMRLKGTILEGDGAPGAGTGGGLIPVPQVIPGIVGKLFQPLRVEELLGANIATTSTVRYIVEGTATPGAGGVLEAGTKPESTLGLSTQDEPIRKSATVMTVSDEVLEDVAELQNYVGGRMSLFVDQEVERQLLRGTATPETVGLFNRGIPIFAGGTSTGTYADQIFTAINNTRGSSFMEPGWLVMHPTDYAKLRLLKDTAGQYSGGGPFLGAYGGVQMAGDSNQITGATDTVWNKPVIVTNATGAGTALIGNSEAASVWNRGGMSIEITNSHLGYFTQNLVALRAERRFGLALYRKAAFCEVRLA
jgi:HK97 family phage major capsid protein